MCADGEDNGEGETSSHVACVANRRRPRAESLLAPVRRVVFIRLFTLRKKTFVARGARRPVVVPPTAPHSRGSRRVLKRSTSEARSSSPRFPPRPPFAGARARTSRSSLVPRSARSPRPGLFAPGFAAAGSGLRRGGAVAFWEIAKTTERQGGIADTELVLARVGRVRLRRRGRGPDRGAAMAQARSHGVAPPPSPPSRPPPPASVPARPPAVPIFRAPACAPRSRGCFSRARPRPPSPPAHALTPAPRDPHPTLRAGSSRPRRGVGR